MTCIYQKYRSPIGPLYLVARENVLLALIFECNWDQVKENYKPFEQRNSALLKETQKQLDEYFARKRKTFDLPYELQGTTFQNRVWKALSKIPFGKTKTYKEQAVSVDAPNACRAVGRTNGLNPLSIVLPCHRVIGSLGTLTGYGGGLAAKKFLLDLEGVTTYRSAD